MNSYLIINSLLAFFFITLGMLALLRNNLHLSNRLFAVFCLATSVWIVTNNFAADITVPHVLADISNRLVFVAAGAMLLTVLAFLLNISGWGPRGRKWKLLVWANVISWLLVASPLGLEGVSIKENTWITDMGYAATPFLVIVLVMAVWIVYVLVKGHKKLTGIRKKQIDNILLSCVLMLPILLFTNVLMPAFGRFEFTQVGSFSSIILVMGMGYGIFMNKLFDIKLVITLSIGYWVTFGLLTMVYGFLALGLITLLDISSSRLHYVTAVSIIAIILLMFEPLRRWFDSATNSVFHRSDNEMREIIDRLNQIFISSMNVKDLIKQVAEVLEKVLKTNHVRIDVRSESAGGSAYMYSTLDPASANKQDFGPILRYMEKKSMPLLFVDYLPEDQAAIRELCNENNILVFARVTHEYKKADNDRAYIILGSKQNGSGYSLPEEKVIGMAAKELYIGIQNALQYNKIKNFNNSLQQKIDDATKKLKMTNERLKKIDETKDEFISMASHQLRTPLTSVKGYVSMVLDGDVGPINDQQRQLLNQSFQSSQRMANLISDLLNLSRINTGKFVIDATPLNLNDIVTEEFNQLREMAEAKNISFTYEAPSDFPTLMFDDGKMHQVVMNLMDNALYYTPPGGTVSVQLVETPNTIEFRVVDSGIGVPRDAQKFLFTKMYRADNARRARPDGTGLGLFLVKKVVAEQKGATIFETIENKGSTFGFRFNKRDHIVPEGFVAKTV